MKQHDNSSSSTAQELNAQMHSKGSCHCTALLMKQPKAVHWHYAKAITCRETSTHKAICRA
jgi:hypothetical protein